MDFSQFLKDENQNLSSTRLAFLSWIFTILIVWLVTSLLPHSSENNHQLQKIPDSVLALVGILMTGKVTQKFKESQSQTSKQTPEHGSLDGNTIASGNLDNTLKLWNLQGQVVLTLNNHGFPLTSVAFSPDGNTIASASLDNTVKLWNLQGQVLQTFKNYGSVVTSVAFSPDGNTIAAVSLDNTVKLWNLQGQVVQTLNHHGSPVTSVAFSPNGNNITSPNAHHKSDR
ncbi:MAG: hypothetical protein QNJ47_02140 [Nostocaceae cyanobacterium]|nr:hypothetical protein [Nostocaceae cyanobacterium]